ncbi:MAG: hypothetical protein ACHQK9_11925 [Reyranellales bacterium]
MLRFCIVAALCLAAGGTLAQDVGFLLVNSTSYPISGLHLSPPNLNFWGRNSLQPPPIKVGQARRVNVAPYGTECIQDVRAVFADDSSVAVWQGLNLCNLTKLTLFFDRTSGITTAKYE